MRRLVEVAWAVAWLVVLGCGNPRADRVGPALPRTAPPSVTVAPLPLGPPAAETEGRCRGATLPLDTEPPEGPFATFEGICEHALTVRTGNDAPRVCYPDVAGDTLSRPSFPLAGAITDARVVAHDAGGDYVHCNLAVRTVAGWTVFWGPACDNTMNDDAYDFTVHELALRPGPRGVGSVLVYRFTSTSFIGKLTAERTKGSFLSLCGVPAGSDQPVCGTVPEAMASRHEMIDFRTELHGDSVWLGGPAERHDLPWVVVSDALDSAKLLEFLDPPRRFCLPFFK